MHLSGLRLLVPLLTPENHLDVLQTAACKSKREIEELVASLSPRPLAPTLIRKVPIQARLAAQPQVAVQPQLTVEPQVRESQAPAGENRTPAGVAIVLNPGKPTSRMAPLTEDAFKFQFTGSRALRDKVREAQELLRHRVPSGDVATLTEMAYDLLIAQVKKERFAIGRKARQQKPSSKEGSASRHIPDDIKRAVYARDDGQCTFTDETGRRCAEKGSIEYDHTDGFALTRAHSIERIRLLCRAHNQHAADRLFGREFMDRARARTNPTCSGPKFHRRARELFWNEFQRATRNLFQTKFAGPTSVTWR